jgi:hypothetical protein
MKKSINKAIMKEAKQPSAAGIKTMKKTVNNDIMKAATVTKP